MRATTSRHDESLYRGTFDATVQDTHDKDSRNGSNRLRRHEADDVSRRDAGESIGHGARERDGRVGE